MANFLTLEIAIFISGGKTAAFLLPIITGILKDNSMSSQFSEKQEPAAIVLSPTRELANQTYIEAMKFSKGERRGNTY